jgi:transposase-like protein
MGRKTKKQQAWDLLKQLNKDDLKEILDSFDLGSTNNSYENVENLLRKECPNCHSLNHIKKTKNNINLTIFKCKDCKRKFNILSQTPLEKTPYEWPVWVTVLEQMLKNQSINNITSHLIASGIVKKIDDLTVSAMVNKIRNSFISMPLPDMVGVVQCDEKHFKESQKGIRHPIDVVLDLTIKGSTRRGRKRSKASKLGTMGPEFSTVCCAVDSNGHSLAKVVTMGHMKLGMFENKIASHFEDITFLCSDMNPIYTQYAAIHKVPQYVINSAYHKIMDKCSSKAQKVAAYEDDKLDYIAGAGTMNYDKMVNFRDTNKLTINGVNGYHSGLERYINRIAKGVSTKHLQAWISFFNYRNNFRIDNGHAPISYTDAEIILIELLKLRIPIKIADIKSQKDTTTKNDIRYTKKFITATVAARIKSNNPLIKFTEEDGIWVINKRKSLDLLPEYKRRMLAKELGIRPYSPTSISSSNLKKKLLAIPDLEDNLYLLANGDKLV